MANDLTDEEIGAMLEIARRMADALDEFKESMKRTGDALARLADALEVKE